MNGCVLMSCYRSIIYYVTDESRIQNRKIKNYGVIDSVEIFSLDIKDEIHVKNKRPSISATINIYYKNLLFNITPIVSYVGINEHGDTMRINNGDSGIDRYELDYLNSQYISGIVKSSFFLSANLDNSSITLQEVSKKVYDSGKQINVQFNADSIRNDDALRDYLYEGKPLRIIVSILIKGKYLKSGNDFSFEQEFVLYRIEKSQSTLFMLH